MCKLLFLSLILLLAASGCLTSLVDQSTTEKVFDHHVQSYFAKDFDAILSDYSDAAFIILNNKVYQGQDQMRAVFIETNEILDHGELQLLHTVVKNQIITITSKFIHDAYGSFVGTDTFIVEDGKIQAHVSYSEIFEKFPLKC